MSDIHYSPNAFNDFFCLTSYMYLPLAQEVGFQGGLLGTLCQQDGPFCLTGHVLCVSSHVWFRFYIIIVFIFFHELNKTQSKFTPVVEHVERTFKQTYMYKGSTPLK